VLLNVVAPAVMEQHFTFGFTHPISKRSELNFAAFYGPRKTVTGGDGALSFGPPGDNGIKIHMHQYEVELSWGYKF